MQEASEPIYRLPLFARAEPDDEYEFPKPEPIDQWDIEQNDRDELIEDPDDEDEE